MAIWDQAAFVAEQGTILPVPNKDLSGQTVIVTGANQGIGFEAALHVAQLNAARLILACRDMKSAAEAAEKISNSLSGDKRSSVKIETWFSDLASLKTVKAFVDRASEKLERLDILFANAGLAKGTREETVDGLDTCTQVNNVANSYLCKALIPLLQRTAKETNTKSYMVVTASNVHLMAPDLVGQDGKSAFWSFNDQGKDGGKYMPYTTTKLMNVLDCETLAQIAGPEVLVSSVNPGLCVSNLNRDMVGEAKKRIEDMRTQLGWTSEMGSRNLLWAASNEYPSGSYISGCKVSEKSDFALSEQGKAAGKEIWADYEKIWAEAGI